MAVLPRLLPDNWNQYPSEAKDSYWQNEITVEDIEHAIIEEYDLPTGLRSDGSFRREQWRALALALDNQEDTCLTTSEEDA